MKASHIVLALKRAIFAKRAAFIWGAPGVGKSQVVAQVARGMKLDLIDVRAVLLDPVDLRGLPHINGDNKAHWCAPEFLPSDGEGILFLDELNAAPPLVQAACYQLVLDRKLGEYTLPDGWIVIAAGNRDEDRAVTHRMSSALESRFVHMEFDVDLDDWVSWALSNDVVTELISFLRYRPNLLHDFDPKRKSKGFPTPRTWELVSDLMKTKPEDEVEFELYKGTVGEGAAAELVGFLKIFRNLPNPDLILMNPDSVAVPTDPATLYALVGALVRKVSDQTFDRLVRYFNRMPAEFSVLAMRDSLKVNKELVNTKAFIDWSSKHSEVLI